MTEVRTLARVMEEALEAFNARDLDGFVEKFTPDVEAHTLLAELAGAPYHGHAGLRRWWGETLESWEYQTIELEEVRGEGDTGVAFISLAGRGKASGVELDMRLAMLFRLEGELCSFFRIYADRDEALRAATIAGDDRP
jgi:ketosteroid isomerase-like protein